VEKNTRYALNMRVISDFIGAVAVILMAHNLLNDMGLIL
jgi:hypothetical protein